jgi:predicted transcriptional regulator
MTHNQIVTDILYLIYVDELVAENFVYDEKGYQQALNEAIKAGLITKKSTTYQLTDKGIALVESGGSEDYMNK